MLHCHFKWIEVYQLISEYCVMYMNELITFEKKQNWKYSRQLQTKLCQSADKTDTKIFYRIWKFNSHVERSAFIVNERTKLSSGKGIVVLTISRLRRLIWAFEINQKYWPFKLQRNWKKLNESLRKRAVEEEATNSIENQRQTSSLEAGTDWSKINFTIWILKSCGLYAYECLSFNI